MFRNYKAIRCKDGFSMSVQAGEFIYCRPRNNIGPKVEVGFPSEKEELLMPFMQEGEDGADTKPTETVYPYVPSEIITKVIAKHGGRATGELPPMVSIPWGHIGQRINLTFTNQTEE